VSGGGTTTDTSAGAGGVSPACAGFASITPIDNAACKPTAKQSQSTPPPLHPKHGQAANQPVHSKLSDAVQPHHQGPNINA